MLGLDNLLVEADFGKLLLAEGADKDYSGIWYGLSQ